MDLPSRCNADNPPSSVDIFSIAFGNAIEAIVVSAQVVCVVDMDIQILAIVPEFLMRAPFVIVRPLAIYPAAAVPPATAYHQLNYVIFSSSSHFFSGWMEDMDEEEDRRTPAGNIAAPAVAATAPTAIESRAIVAADFNIE